MKTFIPKDKDINRKIYLVDASGKTLGRLATRVASLLIGKGKALEIRQRCGEVDLVILDEELSGSQQRNL